MIIKPYLIVPRLIPQPTWGGDYIATFKSIGIEQVKQLKVGQAYELCDTSSLSTLTNSEVLPLEMAGASDGQVTEVVGDPHTLFPLQHLINDDPEKVLGSKPLARFGQTMQLLIKFTQAKGNSFQVHLMPGQSLNNWKPKPESWYFFESGKVTLGLKSPQQLDAYKQVCKTIEVKVGEIASKVKNQQIDIAAALQEIADFVLINSPFTFVNQLNVAPGTVVDLAAGGIHHSWEEGEDIPQGNILYEVQLNVMDNACTMRSFDKGKMGDDGTVRPLQIDDYFAALNTDPTKNDPAKLISQPVSLATDVKASQIFTTYNYQTIKLEIAANYQGKETKPEADQSFHHLFIKAGSVDLKTDSGFLHVTQGASVFIPAAVKSYEILTTNPATILKTWV